MMQGEVLNQIDSLLPSLVEPESLLERGTFTSIHWRLSHLLCLCMYLLVVEMPGDSYYLGTWLTTRQNLTQHTLRHVR